VKDRVVSFSVAEST